ncbi:MAG: hypothetical protein H0V18_10185 [Pyrinomonadaceae bacterium]|nr:hypothetical protein [Pyrinomonadaceae bacterium]
MSTANILPRVHIGEVVRNAVLFNPENSRERAVNSDVLIETVARFFSLLREREIEHVLVGGMRLCPRHYFVEFFGLDAVILRLRLFLLCF